MPKPLCPFQFHCALCVTIASRRKTVGNCVRPIQKDTIFCCDLDQEKFHKHAYAKDAKVQEKECDAFCYAVLCWLFLNNPNSSTEGEVKKKE